MNKSKVLVTGTLLQQESSASKDLMMSSRSEPMGDSRVTIDECLKQQAEKTNEENNLKTGMYNKKRRSENRGEENVDSHIPIKYMVVCVPNCRDDRLWSKEMVQCASKDECVSEAYLGFFHPACWKLERGISGYCIHCVKNSNFIG